MKLRKQLNFSLTATIFASTLLLIGCSINDSNINSPSSDALTPEELEVAGQIIAESLSDEKDGIFSSLNDAFTLPSPNSFAQNLTIAEDYQSAVFKIASLAKSNTNQSNYSYTYEPSNGTHHVSFTRSINTDKISKESTAELEYIYYDVNNHFITSPRLENESIEIIDYIGVKSGSLQTSIQNSSYERKDQFVISGLSGNSTLLTIDGIHEGSGQFKSTRTSGNVIERYYELTVEFLSVEINNQTVESNGSLNKGVTGALAYELFISRSVNGDESMKSINGTIEFNGDGTALLRFRNILNEFQIKLETGTLLEEDEFDGFVESANNSENRFTLFNGETFLLTSESEISLTGDLISLDEVEAVIENNVRVSASGLYVTDEAGSKLVQTVEFNFEQEDVEFDNKITSVQVSDNTLTLSNGLVLLLTDDSVIDEDGHLNNLDDVELALENGNSVKASGEFQPQTDGTKIVLSIEFNYDDQDFEDFVSSADVNQQIFTLSNGSEYNVNANSDFNDDISSIEELDVLLQEGYKVEAEGVYFIDADGLSIVLKVDFNIEDFEESTVRGVVGSVNISAQTFSLVNGLTFQVNSRTNFEEGYRDLNELAAALQTENAIRVTVNYFTDSNGNNVALILEFNSDGDDNENGRDFDEGSFDGKVQTTNLIQQTFVLKNGLLLDVNSDTEIIGDEIKSLEELNDILNAGHTVHASGEYVTNNNGRNIVTEVEFEVEEEEFEEQEFSGEAHHVNLNQRFFIVRNGLVLHVDFNTEFNGSEIMSLEDLNDALENGHTIKAVGEYFTNNTGRNIVTEVEFEIDEDDIEETEFSGKVQTVNLNQQFFILRGGPRLVTNSNTEFNGDISSLEELSTALNAGQNVDADGEYFTNNTGQNIVIQVTFTVEENQDDNGNDGDDNSGSDHGNDGGNNGSDHGNDGGNNGSEDDDQGDGSQFQGTVQNVNLNQNFFMLHGGHQYYVNSETSIEGDYDSLQEVSDALSSGNSVSASGTFIKDNRNRNIATKVTFETSN